MKSWHSSLPSFKPFVIVFHFLLRRLAKRDAAAYAQTNDYYDHPDPDDYDYYDYEYRRLAKRAAPVAKKNLTKNYDVYGGVDPKPAKAYADPSYEQPAKYVQLFSCFSSLNFELLLQNFCKKACFYRICVKKRNRKDPSMWKIMHQNCEKKFTNILLCPVSS